MGDPRLNSIHLPDQRRVEYRHAREVLLQSRGYQTVCAVEQLPRDVQSQTFIESPDSPPAQATYWLVDRNGTYPLKIGVNTVGRSGDNDVVVQDGCVSRRHCAILVHVTSGCELHDTASKNGTFLNGARLSGPTRLRPGDEIRMCDQQYVFQARPDAPLGLPGNDATFSQ
jgi:pSer/pThr/pTyr-binding forkhead associated (FHA) protein